MTAKPPTLAHLWLGGVFKQDSMKTRWWQQNRFSILIKKFEKGKRENKIKIYFFFFLTC